MRLRRELHELDNDKRGAYQIAHVRLTTVEGLGVLDARVFILLTWYIERLGSKVGEMESGAVQSSRRNEYAAPYIYQLHAQNPAHTSIDNRN